jgi:transposase
MERPAHDREVVTTVGGLDVTDRIRRERGLAANRQSRTRREPVMKNDTSWVGLDAHKKSISVAILYAGRSDVVEMKIENDAPSVRRLVSKLAREAPGEVFCCYEAGPCGYVLKRQIEQLGDGKVQCDVIAPSLIPSKPGARIKTDRRDARKLAELLRAGLLTAVCPPTAEEEAVRDLCRCREDAREDLHRARHRLVKLLLRRGLVFQGTKAWSIVWRRWLHALRFEHIADQVVFDDYVLAVERLEDRLKALDGKIIEAAAQPLYREPVAWLRCFRGVDTVTALGIVSELHGVRRFQSPRQLMAYLGLVPSEHSSADKTRRGSITKTGNVHVRRLLIESAWHYRHKPGAGVALRKRRHEQPARVVAIADKAQQRLHRRFWSMTMKGKSRNTAVVAIARELVGFVWAALYVPETIKSQTT